MRLTIISHTEHYRNADGTIVGLGSTVTEINHLMAIFDEIVHVAMLHESKAPPSALPYDSEHIEFVPLPALGGPKVTDKLQILWKSPQVLQTVMKAINRTDVYQFRAPTGIGVFVIPYLCYFSSKKGWFKYAGNWKQKNAPLAYSFQRWMLKHQKHKVTINGAWDDQPKHCLTFENPCLTQWEITEGQKVIAQKCIAENPISLCFVGRLEEEKGIGLFIKALLKLPPVDKSRIDHVHIVGSGTHENVYKDLASDETLQFKFHGFLSRSQVHEVYKKSHAIVLPSASEGFPKVIAEALNYGALPIVSDVSSIGHYIKDRDNGFLLHPISEVQIINAIKSLLALSDSDYRKMVSCSGDELKKFTYSYYNERIQKDIL